MKFVPISDEVLKQLEDDGYVAVHYADPVSGERLQVTSESNGSANDIAGICENKVVFGLVLTRKHTSHHLIILIGHTKDQWDSSFYGLGLKMFRNAVDFVKETLV